MKNTVVGRPGTTMPSAPSATASRPRAVHAVRRTGPVVNAAVPIGRRCTRIDTSTNTLPLISVIGQRQRWRPARTGGCSPRSTPVRPGRRPGRSRPDALGHPDRGEDPREHDVGERAADGRDQDRDAEDACRLVFLNPAGCRLCLCHRCSSIHTYAEGVGFEPTVGCPTHALQACRFGRSRIPPGG